MITCRSATQSKLASTHLARTFDDASWQLSLQAVILRHLCQHSLIRAQLCQRLCPNSVKVQQPDHARSHCRVSFYAKLRFVIRHDTESLFIAEIQQFLQGISADAEVLRLAACKVYFARYGRAEDVMTASLSSRTQQVLAVDISEPTQSWSQPQREPSCLGWCTTTRLAWHDLKMRAQCVHAATHHVRCNTSTSFSM